MTKVRAARTHPWHIALATVWTNSEYISCIPAQYTLYIPLSLRLNMHEHYTNLRAAFKASDKESLGYLRKIDLRRILFEFNFLVDDDQFDFLLKRCGMEKKNRMSYEKFLKFFEGPQTEVAGIDNFDALENRSVTYMKLTSPESKCILKPPLGPLPQF